MAHDEVVTKEIHGLTITMRTCGSRVVVDISLYLRHNCCDRDVREVAMPESAVNAIKKSIAELRQFSKDYLMVDGKVIPRQDLASSKKTIASERTKAGTTKK